MPSFHARGRFRQFGPASVLTPVQALHRVITRLVLHQAGLKADPAEGGDWTLIQRFGSAADLYLHLHWRVRVGLEASNCA